MRRRIWRTIAVLTLISATGGRAQVLTPSGMEMAAPATIMPLTTAPAAPVPLVDAPEPPAANRFWVQVDYLFWWLKPGPLGTPLVTTDPSQGVARGSGGLANPTTQVVLGGHDIDFPPLSGGRLRAGCALGDGFGIEAGGFLLQQQSPTWGSRPTRTAAPSCCAPLSTPTRTTSTPASLFPCRSRRRSPSEPPPPTPGPFRSTTSSSSGERMPS